MFLTSEQESHFKRLLLKAIEDESMPLPDGWEADKVYRSEYYKYGMRGGMNLRFFIKEDKGNLYLDFYIVTDDYSSHNRIDHSGNKTRLENYEGQFGWPVYEGDEEKTKRAHENIREHNQKVHEILKAKGFDE